MEYTKSVKVPKSAEQLIQGIFRRRGDAEDAIRIILSLLQTNYRVRQQHILIKKLGMTPMKYYRLKSVLLALGFVEHINTTEAGVPVKRVQLSDKVAALAKTFSKDWVDFVTGRYREPEPLNLLEQHSEERE
jgi:hypothetical protein